MSVTLVPCLMTVLGILSRSFLIESCFAGVHEHEPTSTVSFRVNEIRKQENRSRDLCSLVVLSVSCRVALIDFKPKFWASHECLV